MVAPWATRRDLTRTKQAQFVLRQLIERHQVMVINSKWELQATLLFKEWAPPHSFRTKKLEATQRQ